MDYRIFHKMKPAFNQTLLVLAAVFLSLFPMLSYAENVKITRVIDCNLFELKDGRRIKLANVESPSVSDPDPALAHLARIIKRFAEEKLPGENLIIEDAGPVDETCNCLPVHLFQKFPLKTVWYNKIYLKEGYGKFVVGQDTSYYKEYFSAAEEARKNGRGVWNPAQFIPQPTQYSINFLVGAGDKPNFSDDYYREVYFSFEPITYEHGFSIVFGLIQTKAVDEPEAPTGYPGSEIRTFHLPYFIPQFRIQGDYFGFNLGLFFNVHVLSRGYPTPFLFPSVALKLGLIRKFYLSVDILNDFLFGFFSAGFNIKIANPNIHLWIGNTVFNSENNAPGFKLSILIDRKYLLKAQGAYIFSEQEKQYGFRLGVGYILGTQ